MNYIPNSFAARDIASVVHMQTNLRRHQEEGPLVISRGHGCRVFDDSGRDYLEAIAGLWCASLGFGSERLAKVAYEQMRELGYYHLYRHRSHEPAVVPTTGSAKKAAIVSGPSRSIATASSSAQARQSAASARPRRQRAPQGGETCGKSSREGA